MALDGEIEVAHETGSRTIATNDFFLDFFTTSLKEDEIIKELHIPLPSPRSGGAYTKMTKGHNDFALVAVAAQTSLNVEGTCERANIVVGGVGSKPMHAGETEKAMLGRRIDDGMLREAAMKATDDLTLTPDPRVSSEVKGEMVRALTLRTLRKALDRARGVV
jgi:CO/xanthine dehydrogenase FAD-binding subunit